MRAAVAASGDLGFSGYGNADWLDFRRRHTGRHFRCRCRRFDFPVASFLDARPEIPVLGALLYDERRATLRAGLVDRFVRSGEVAIGVAAAAVENAAATAAL